MADTALDAINAGNTLDYINKLADRNPITNWGESVGKKIKDYVANGVQSITDKISEKVGRKLNSGNGGSGHAFKK